MDWPLDKVLEPKAIDIGESNPDFPMNDISMISLAISAKRMADALHAIARNDTARTCFTGDGSANTAQLNVGANCDCRSES